MQFIRKIANSDILSGIIEIPNSLKNRKVEILIFPFDDSTEGETLKRKDKSAKGTLTKYRNAELINQESSAWEAAMREKHEHR